MLHITDEDGSCFSFRFLWNSIASQPLFRAWYCAPTGCCVPPNSNCPTNRAAWRAALCEEVEFGQQEPGWLVDNGFFMTTLLATGYL